MRFINLTSPAAWKWPKQMPGAHAPSVSALSPGTFRGHRRDCWRCRGLRGCRFTDYPAIGVGLHGPVSDAEMDALGDFFHSRNAPAAIELCPLVDISVYEKFAARNYHLLELTDVLILDDLDAARMPGTMSAGVTVRVSEPHEAKLWTQTVAEGFAEHDPVHKRYST